MPVQPNAAGLRLAALELREIQMPLKWPFETSFSSTTLRRIMIVRAFGHDGAIGYGECTAGENPYFNHETIDTAWLVISKHIEQLIRESDIDGAALVHEALAPIKGNRMAKAAIECAIWDLEARRLGKPLWQHLGGTRTEIDCGVSIGLQGDTEQLLAKVARELDSGYQRIKIKIKPGRDLELVRAVRASYPEMLLSVDANSAYSLDDFDLFRELDQYNLMMIEQPLEAGDLIDHAALQAGISTPICLDESILSVADARRAIQTRACRIINVKLGRVGGHLEANRIQEYALARGIPVWCGGMLEAGIGRAHNIAMSTLPGFSMPGDVTASGRYWDEDIIEPPVTVTREGRIAAPEGIGIGYEVIEPRIEARTVRREVIRLS